MYQENQLDTQAEEPRAASPTQQKSWLVLYLSLLLRRDQLAQKAGQLFSGLLAVNVVFLGGAFIGSMIFNSVAITLGDVWVLLAVLKGLSLLWLFYYLLGTTRRPHAVLHRDPHAGPIWVRGECWGLGGKNRGGEAGEVPTSAHSRQARWCCLAAALSASTSSVWATT